MRLVGGGNGVPCVVWQATSFSNNGNESSSKMQDGTLDGYRQKIYA